MLNSQKTATITYGRNRKIFNEHLVIKLYNHLRFIQHIGKCLQKAYFSLKVLYPWKISIEVNIKKIFCNLLVLCQFSYKAPVYGPCLEHDTLVRIQRVQNYCLRYIFGKRKCNRVSHTLKCSEWLKIKELSVMIFTP